MSVFSHGSHDDGGDGDISRYETTADSWGSYSVSGTFTPSGYLNTLSLIFPTNLWSRCYHHWKFPHSREGSKPRQSANVLKVPWANRRFSCYFSLISNWGKSGRSCHCPLDGHSPLQSYTVTLPFKKSSLFLQPLDSGCDSLRLAECARSEEEPVLEPINHGALWCLPFAATPSYHTGQRLSLPNASTMKCELCLSRAVAPVLAKVPVI